MSSVNKAIILGNCGRDPEVRYTPAGVAICNVSIATSSKRKDKQSGEMIEDTQWHRVTFYDRLAEVAGEYLRKGKQVYVEGRIKYGKYTDKDGVERNSVDIVAESMQLLGGRDEGGGNESGTRQGQSRGDGARQQPRSNDRGDNRPQGQQRPAPSPRAAPKSGTSFDDMDDDIPF